MAAVLRALRQTGSSHYRCLGASSSSAIQGKSAAFRQPWIRGMATKDSIPESADPAVKKALKQLFAVNWSEIDEKTEGIVEGALRSDKGGEDFTALQNSWSAALAVQNFYGTLEALRKSIDDLMGLAGENTGPLPEKHQKALEVVHSKYIKYLSSFADHELYLKKKVEVELGSVLVLLKQRVSGLPPKWGDVGLLGTSGLSGSYIEYRA